MKATRADPISRAARMTASLVLIVACAVGLARSIMERSTPEGVAPTAHRVDLNSADAALLELLPRIGPALARKIVEDRAARGPYAHVEDLDRVPGIGPRTIELLRPHVMIVESPRPDHGIPSPAQSR